LVGHSDYKQTNTVARIFLSAILIDPYVEQSAAKHRSSCASAAVAYGGVDQTLGHTARLSYRQLSSG
jgi:hypothetical protein